MDENKLRRKARISGLRGPALLVGFTAICWTIAITVPLSEELSYTRVSMETVGLFVACVLGGLLVLALCAVPFLLPVTVFAPAPVDATAPRPQVRTEVQATGRFRQVKRVEPPTVEFETRSRKFVKAVANVIPLAPRKLLIYIRHVVRVESYGKVVNETETHWGALINADDVLAVEPGRVFGKKEQEDRWAVRFQYPTGSGEKPQTLFVMFRNPGAQADLVDLLKKLAFTVAASQTP